MSPAANVNLVVSNETDAAQSYIGPKTMYRIYYQSPFWFVQVRNPGADSYWQDVRQSKPTIAYNEKGFPVSVFPLEHFDTRTEADAYCKTSFTGLGIEQFVVQKRSFFKRIFGRYED